MVKVSTLAFLLFIIMIPTDCKITNFSLFLLNFVFTYFQPATAKNSTKSIFTTNLASTKASWCYAIVPPGINCQFYWLANLKFWLPSNNRSKLSQHYYQHAQKIWLDLVIFLWLLFLPNQIEPFFFNYNGNCVSIIKFQLDFHFKTSSIWKLFA